VAFFGGAGEGAGFGDGGEVAELVEFHRGSLQSTAGSLQLKPPGGYCLAGGRRLWTNGLLLP
jgi:hypothetical protein